MKSVCFDVSSLHKFHLSPVILLVQFFCYLSWYPCEISSWPLILFCQVIPTASCKLPVGTNEKPSNLYAFVSIEDTSKPDDEPKALRGQIRMCNLTKFRLVGGPLAEVQSFSYYIYIYIYKLYVEYCMDIFCFSGSSRDM